MIKVSIYPVADRERLSSSHAQALQQVWRDHSSLLTPWTHHASNAMPLRGSARRPAAFYSNGSATKLEWPIGDTVAYEANKSRDIEDKIFSNN